MAANKREGIKFLITEPIYRVELNVCIGMNFKTVEDDLLASGLPPLDDEQKPNRYTKAQTMFPPEWNRIGWLWVSAEYQHDSPEWSGTIGHEMFHVAMEVFRAVGMSEVCEHNEEAFSYYLTFLIRSFNIEYIKKRSK